MDRKYMPAFISLSAGFVVCIFCIVKSVNIIKSLVLVLVFLLAFYIVGIVAKKLFEKILANVEVEIPKEESEEIEEAEKLDEEDSKSDKE